MKPGELPLEGGETASPVGKKLLSPGEKKLRAAVQREEERIGGRGALEDRKAPFDLPFRDQLALPVQPGGLCEAWKCLMDALHAKIRAELDRGARKKALSFPLQAKVRPVRFIHIERNSPLVAERGDRLDIRDLSLIHI